MPSVSYEMSLMCVFAIQKQSQLEQQLDMRRADLDLMHHHLRDVQSELVSD